jgi:hypothetical protein
MLKLGNLLVLCVVWLMVATVNADLYFWVDENGVKHFTDRPPEDRSQAGKTKHYSTPDYPFSHRLYKQEGDSEYCGKYRLPDAGSGPKIQLINTLAQYKQMRKQRPLIRDRLLKAPTGIAKQNYHNELDECDCIIEWTRKKIQALEPVKQQIIKEARLAQKEYDDIKSRCGEEPRPGWHTDEEAIEWAKCQKKIIKQHNKLLKKLKQKINMENALRDAMQEN